MVPEALAGPGKQGARLGAHGKRAARRAKGLEGTLVDREKRRITCLDPTDTRTATVWVAGPAALLVAKIHKIAERVVTQDRVRDKDAAFLDLKIGDRAAFTYESEKGGQPAKTVTVAADGRWSVRRWPGGPTRFRATSEGHTSRTITVSTT